jgi:hypothetical protein
MPRKLTRVSARKIAANRQNAVKSTGPKTPEGKANSRRNAFKDGLFAMDTFVRGFAKRENPQLYKELLVSLREDYQPVGAAENLEVERIAACWWKLGRAWRYENSEIVYELIDVENRRLRLLSPQEAGSDSPLSQEHATIYLLKRVQAEIEATGKISDDLKGKMVTTNGGFQQIWALIEDLAGEEFRQRGNDISVGNVGNGPAPTGTECSTKFLFRHIQIATDFLEQRLNAMVEDAMKGAFDRMAVPPEEALDRFLRAEGAAERNLSRAMDRLERLQRRRKGEVVSPPVSVRLTR